MIVVQLSSQDGWDIFDVVGFNDSPQKNVCANAATNLVNSQAPKLSAPMQKCSHLGVRLKDFARLQAAAVPSNFKQGLKDRLSVHYKRSLSIVTMCSGTDGIVDVLED